MAESDVIETAIGRLELTGGMKRVLDYIDRKWSSGCIVLNGGSRVMCYICPPSGGYALASGPHVAWEDVLGLVAHGVIARADNHGVPVFRRPASRPAPPADPVPGLIDAWHARPTHAARHALWEALKGSDPAHGDEYDYRGVRYAPVPSWDRKISVGGGTE